MTGYSQAVIERTYQNWARVYDTLTPAYLLGNERKLREKTIRSLRLRPGQHVLDIACGTGRNFPLILDQIGPAGKLVGVDYTAAMLDRARERVEREGWTNVELIHADAARVELNEQFDAALCTLAIGVIPDDRAALQRMLASLRVGGQLAIGDARRTSRWYGWAFNWLAELLGYGAAEVMSREPWETLRGILADFHYEDWFSGYFYVAGGSRP